MIEDSYKLVLICILFVAAVAILFAGNRPRVRAMCLGVVSLGIGGWLSTSAYDLWQEGRAMTFSRHATSFAIASNPALASLSFWFNVVVGAFVSAFGALLIGIAASKLGGKLKNP